MLSYSLKAFDVSFVAITDKTDEKQQARPGLLIAIFVDQRVKVKSYKRLLLRVAKADFYTFPLQDYVYNSKKFFAL